MTDNTSGRGEVTLVEGDVEFDDQDVALLRAIDHTGSVAKATSELGRSRARATTRIDDLEAAFGPLVERQRGGSGGGGSQLTETASELLSRYDRLAAAVTATARVPETVLAGRVRSISGELAAVETPVGAVRGLQDGLSPDDPVQVRVGADAVTVLAGTEPAENSTSAQNRFQGTVSEIERGETVFTLRVAVADTEFRALVTAESASRLDLRRGSAVSLTWKATATRLVANGE